MADPRGSSGTTPVAAPRLSAIDAALERLVSGRLYAFRDWPEAAVPPVAAGVYSVWRGPALLYVGWAGRGLSARDLERRRLEGDGELGLASRLAAHAAGRRAGDPFSVLVADRLVLPRLGPAEVEAIAAGRASLDARVREAVREELTYRFAVVEDGRTALTLERQARAGALGHPVPAWNPLARGRPRRALAEQPELAVGGGRAPE